MVSTFRQTVFVIAVLGCCSLANATILTHYTFDNTLADTAAAGATADNLTAYNNSGTVVTPVYESGVLGNAAAVGLVASGRPNVLQALDSNDLDLATTEWTMEMYVRPDSLLGSSWDRLCMKWVGGTGYQYHWNLQNLANNQQLYVNGGAVDLQGTVTVAGAAWTHIAITDSVANGLQIWQNGLVVASTGYQTIVSGTCPMDFANMLASIDLNCQFSGLIDDFMIHDEAKGAAYMQTRTAAIPEPSTVVLLLVALGMFLYRAPSIIRR
jgi:hypothetical protein